MTPERIQLSRHKGWRMPANTVKVDRSTRWGNPWRIGVSRCTGKGFDYREEKVANARTVVRFFCDTLREEERNFPADAEIKKALAGKKLACWCKLCPEHKDGKPLGVECDACDPCHADVLLEIANR